MLEPNTENPYSADAATQLSQVSIPPSNRPHSFAFGMTLLVLSIATCFLGLFGFAFFFASYSEPGSTFSFSDPVFYGPLLIVLWNTAIAYGSVGILRSGSLFSARVTTCLAMVPFLGPFYFAGTLVGIWGLNVLRRRQVIASFNSTMPPR